MTSTGGAVSGATGFEQDASVADVSQLSVNSTTTINQYGTNTAIVTQGANLTEDYQGDNTILIQQTDAGDTATSGSGGGIFNPGGSGSTNAGSNFAEVTQYGTSNSTTVAQNAVNASALVFQTLGSVSNTLNIQQGTNNGAGFTGDTGANAVSLRADVTQSGNGSSASLFQSGDNLQVILVQNGNDDTSNNSARITQTNINNWASVTQTGEQHQAFVDQLGAGGADSRATGGRDLRSKATVEQTGDSHYAEIFQRETSGVSTSSAPAAGDATFADRRAAGVQPAEAIILQSGSELDEDDPGGNRAVIDQRGRGQYARIEQDGRGNIAGIVQGVNATNAVAIIEQQGDGNQYYITQAEAGQFMRVNQTGNDNNVTTTQSSGPGTPPGGVGSGTSQPALP